MLRSPLACSAQSQAIQNCKPKNNPSLIASISASVTTSTNFCGQLVSRLPPDPLAQREQNPRYAAHNGLTTASSDTLYTDIDQNQRRANYGPSAYDRRQ